MSVVSPELLRDVGIAANACFEASQVRECPGGSISRCCVLSGAGTPRYFLKTHAAALEPLFASEARGLLALAQADAVRVPAVVAAGCTGAQAWLLLEYLELGPKTAAGAAIFGRQLARLHRQTSAQFGFDADNYIGSTPQSNRRGEDWIAFFAEHRLGFQLELAARTGHARAIGTRGAELIDALPALFAGHRPAPSLLHGDLWGGNWGVTTDGAPVFFDPAVYYGDRETDIAMTRLFGGVPGEFYAAYERAWPLDDGHEFRAGVYNLYHVLNHLNLFGGGYLRQAIDLMDRLLRR